MMKPIAGHCGSIGYPSIIELSPVPVQRVPKYLRSAIMGALASSAESCDSARASEPYTRM